MSKFQIYFHEHLKQYNRTGYTSIYLFNSLITTTYPLCVLELSAPRRVARNSQWGGCCGGLGAEPPALENFAFFAKITSFWGYFD